MMLANNIFWVMDCFDESNCANGHIFLKISKQFIYIKAYLNESFNANIYNSLVDIRIKLRNSGTSFCPGKCW